ncbi:MAG: AAA family ATPase [Armatimonadota bacterium]|nr:AAA family ATPase [Armatimonadota bacterium]
MLELLATPPPLAPLAEIRDQIVADAGEHYFLGVLHYPSLYATAHDLRGLTPLLTDFYERTAEVERLCTQPDLKRMVYSWTETEGLVNVATPDHRDPSTRDPLRVLDAVLSEMHHAVFVLKDYHCFLREHEVIRRLRDCVALLKRGSVNRTIILLSPVMVLPQELEKDITVVDFPLPSTEERAAILRAVEESLQRQGRAKVNLDRGARERLLSAAQGLTASEMENALARAVIARQALDADTIPLILSEKKQIIRKSGVLEYFAPEEEFADIGGLDALKAWLRKRSDAFSERARAFGLPEPKGVLLVGVQGCGKSLSAKALAALWRLPLLRMDVGRLFSGLVGASEENLRKAIRVAESLSPAILWIDELEKGFAGVASSNVSDAGTAARVFGTFITWLQEKKAPVFVVATANDVTQLPPEMVRQGRFDEVFFVDLPDREERRQILAIHLRKRNRRPADFDLDRLADASEGFSGAELEQAVVAGLYDAFGEGRPLSTEDIAANLRETVPLSQMMSEQVNALRRWAQTRARWASGLTWKNPPAGLE